MGKITFDTFVNTPVTADVDLKLRLAAARQRVTRAEVCRRAYAHYLAELDRAEKNEGGGNDNQNG